MKLTVNNAPNLPEMKMVEIGATEANFSGIRFQKGDFLIIKNQMSLSWVKKNNGLV